jgi:hypothetical protein
MYYLKIKFIFMIYLSNILHLIYILLKNLIYIYDLLSNILHNKYILLINKIIVRNIVKIFYLIELYIPILLISIYNKLFQLL